MRLSEIKPYKKNAKKHDETQIKNVMQSIMEFGVVQPIVVDRNNTIIIGHCRYEAMKRLGYDELQEDWVKVVDLSEEEAEKLRLLDNKLNESEWDVDLLKDLVPSIDFSDFEIDFNLPEEEKEKEKKLPIAILMVLGGFAGLIFGGRIFVNSACDIARMAGLSDKFIAVTILAGGTSMPELVTCIVAAAKKKDQLALGNILGSNISNILLILGCSSVFFRKTSGGPDGLAFTGMSNMDIFVFLISSLVILASAYTGRGKTRRIDRADGLFFVAIEIAYLIWLITNLN